MKKDPTVSVIIPVKQLSYFLIYENLPSFENQTSKDFEVIVLPNEQALYDLTLLKKYPWLRILPTGSVTRPAMKRDIGAKNAKGSIIAFLDDDAYVTADWIRIGIKDLKSESIAAVGGPGKVPPGSGIWEKSFDQILTSTIGSGSNTYRFTEGKKQYVDDYPSMNFFVRKKIFDAIGGFNNDYWPGEDSKLCNDIVYREKKKILYDPKLLVYHHRRNTLGGFLVQHANYGFHRGSFYAQGDKNSKRLIYLVPSFFVLYLLLLPFIAPALFFPNPLYLHIVWIPIYLYFGLLLFTVFRGFLQTLNFSITLGAALTLLLMHVVYGILFLVGYIKEKQKK